LPAWSSSLKYRIGESARTSDENDTDYPLTRARAGDTGTG
jgi:hypothetical protein